MTKLNENEEGNLVDSDGIEILDSDGNPITTG
jgi:flagellar basal body rod protein FlgG